MADRPDCELDSAAFLDAGRNLIQDNAAGFDCEPECPELIPQFQVSKAGCWKKITDTSGIRYEPCATGVPHDCYDLYDVCCEEDEFGACKKMTAYYFGSTTPEGACTQPCYAVCCMGHPQESHPPCESATELSSTSEQHQ